MAKTLDKSRPKSTIADMIDGELIQQATQPPPPEIPDVIPELVAPVESPLRQASEEIDPATAPSSRSTSVPAPKAKALNTSVGRTGEHSDIQKMYRLTPTAAGTVQELSRCLGESLEFEVNNSVVIRSILRAVHQAEAEIHRLASERLTPRRQPSTAIGNEHLRDAVEAELADIIMEGICRYVQDDRQD